MERPELLGIRLFDLTGRVELVSGAGRGLGRTLALALASGGADMVVSSRSKDELETLAAEIKGLGRRASAITLRRDQRDILRCARRPYRL